MRASCSGRGHQGWRQNRLTGETAGQRKGAKSHGTEVINEEYTRMTNL
jgi:hypothetical protein